MQSLKGSFLIATPGLSDPNFLQTVVFVAEHNGEGAFGLVLTRPSKVNMWELCQKIFDDAQGLPSKEFLESIQTFNGGPVQASAVFFLHAQVEFGEERIEPGVYLGNQADDLRKVLAALEGTSSKHFSLYFGYAGWGAGQLERELDAGGWLIRPAKLELLFSEEPEKLWSQLVQGFGGDFGILSQMPEDPGRN